MNNPLSLRIGAGRIPAGCALWAGGGSQLANNVFSSTVNGEDGAAFQSLGLLRGWRFEWLWMGGEPRENDTIACQAAMDATSDGFHFRQFGHRSIVVEQNSERGGHSGVRNRTISMT